LFTRQTEVGETKRRGEVDEGEQETLINRKHGEDGKRRSSETRFGFSSR
jgi:hypothetical protein